MTVPKVIASGETITIPAGRIAILPNVQIDGVLNVEGEVFIPSGATLGDLDAQLALKAPLVNPAFTNPTATTQAAQDNSTKVATTAYVDGKMVLATAVNTTSGTAIDFTGIPSWVKRIVVMFNGVSTNGVSQVLLRVGSPSGIVSSEYKCINSSIAALSAASSFSSIGFPITETATQATDAMSGKIELVKITSNTWTCHGAVTRRTNISSYTVGASGDLASALDRVRITTANGTDTFDAGQINIMYEG